MQRHSLWDNCDPVALAVLALSVGAVLFVFAIPWTRIRLSDSTVIKTSRVCVIWPTAP